MAVPGYRLLDIEIEIEIGIRFYKSPIVVLNVVQPDITDQFLTTSPGEVRELVLSDTSEVLTIVIDVEFFTSFFICEDSIALDKAAEDKHNLLIKVD